MGSLPPNFSLKISDIEYIDYVIQYLGNSYNDWFTIKKEIINDEMYKKVFGTDRTD